MLRSMTGFGSVRVRARDFILEVEIKGVNNRFLKISTRAPDEIAFLQSDVEEIVRRRVDRGSIFVNIWFEPLSLEGLYDIDEDVLAKYRRRLGHARRRLGETEKVHLRDLLGLPGVVRERDGFRLGRGRIWPVVRDATVRATERLLRMREREGRGIERELRRRNRRIGAIVGRVRRQARRTVRSHHERLRERLTRLLDDRSIPVSDADLAREVAILADRSDFTEEVDRLESHTAQFGESLRVRGPVGRKLDFIVQEMFREASTISAKATDGKLVRDVIEIKSEIDRLREQIQNVE